ncbi:MAG: thiamine pyrophosphate-binding protein [Thermomicrobiales bacterium]|nr:thiamine pyrophosphate-binding protein [Thermomicrobiales bacterium]MCO5222537.1 thiamine pyrophosphate-binding protein [Thermomicrobiales bacterium]
MVAVSPQTLTATGAELVIRALEEHGVDTVFGIPGVHTLALYDALGRSSIRHVLARHEQGVGFMADGYARATGKPGVAVIITGPGVTNIATAVGEAYTDSTPLLVISSNVESPYLDAMRGNLHDLKDQMGVMQAVTKWNARVADPGDVSRTMSQAFAQLESGRPLPVHVEIPLDVLDQTASVEAPAPAAGDETPLVSDETIENAARLLAGAQRPIIYAGGGAVSSGAAPFVLELAERLNAPVITSIMGKGAIPEDHPLSLGALWSAGNAVDDYLQRADAAIVIGSKLGAQATQMFQMALPDTLIRIDIDPREMTLNAQPSTPLLGDAAQITERLAAALSDARDLAEVDQTEEVQAVRQAAEKTSWFAERRAYVDALRRAIPRDGVLSTDMTMMSYVACGLYPVYEPRTFFFPSGFGTLGFSLPAAIGAKIGRPDAAVVAMVGDGGFQYTMGDLGCAVQERLGLPIVIFNDSTYSAVKHAQLEERGGRYLAVDLVNPDYVKLAGAYGIPGVRPTSPEAMEREIRLAFERDLPTIIDVPIEPWV